MAAKMKWARDVNSNAPIGLEIAHSGVSYLCEHCPAEVRYNAGYEMDRKGVSIIVEHYFKLRQKHVHANDCLYNVEALVKTAVRDADPDAVQQLSRGLFELRLMFPESYKTAPPSKDFAIHGPVPGAKQQSRKFVSSGKLNSYLNTAASILKIRNYCEDHQDIEEHLVLSFDGHKVRWSDFYIEQDDYLSIYEKLSAGRIAHPLAVTGIIQDINRRSSQDDPNRPYWFVQLAVPKTCPDAQGVLTKVDAYLTTSKFDLIEDLRKGDKVIVFGAWSVRPPKLSPNSNPKTPNSPIRTWKNLPLKFALSHAKQIVRAKTR